MKMTVEGEASKRVGDEVNIKVTVACDSVESDLIPFFLFFNVKGNARCEYKGFLPCDRAICQGRYEKFFFFKGGEGDE